MNPHDDNEWCCPACGEVGVPEEFRNGAYKVLCGNHEACDYGDYWYVEKGVRHPDGDV